MRRIGIAALLAFCTTVNTGCHTTKVYSGRVKEAGPDQSGLQAFTLAGLLPLSSPDGRECEHGLAWSESEMAALDVVINVGVAIGGYAGAYAMCGGSTADKAFCGTSGASLAPMLFSTRTARWACAKPPSLPPAPTAPALPTTPTGS